MLATVFGENQSAAGDGLALFSPGGLRHSVRNAAAHPRELPPFSPREFVPVFWTLNLPLPSALRVSRIDLRSRVVAERYLRSGGHPLEIVAPVSRGDDHARPSFRRDESVRGHWRAMPEVPRPQK